MKKIIFLLMALMITVGAEAQLFQFGLKAGVSSSKMQVDESFSIDGRDLSYNTGSAKLGWHAGIYSRIKITKLYIQPEILFSSTGGEIEVSEQGVSTPEIGEVSLNKLDIPVMVGYYVAGPLRIFVGPSFSYLISDKFEVSGLEELEQEYNNATIGYQAGLGLDISRIIIDLKYEGNLSKLGDNVTIPGTTETFSTDLRNPQFILSVGFRF